METAKLKKFAQFARRSLLEQVTNRMQLIMAPDSTARRENAEVLRKLDQVILQNGGKQQLIEQVAYTWFNRFCALRFMDVNNYNSPSVVSPAEGQFQPEILAEAKMGNVDKEVINVKIKERVFALLNGQAPSKEPQSEAYRILLVSVCNYWNYLMPFLFERIEDYTELLMPDDLLSESSILAYTREAMTPDTCQDIEVIGWLYQFYISEKKDEVFEGLKKNKKITPENIPAATQLFTPHWIVRYLVENSLGRLWMLNHPGSNLIKQMDYYIKPEQPETDFLKVKSPEEIRICDPACGSGHMLVYAFDLLYSIYEEEGYDASEIPTKILKNNLYGIEIDERAGELAAFALTMKARSRQRGFFRQKVQPNICVLENVKFDPHELKEYMAFIGHDLFTMQLQNTLHQFEEADNFGSLIRPEITDVEAMLNFLNTKNASGNLFVYQAHQKVLRALEQADYLAPKYHVVIANPPYMGRSGMNGRLASWIKDNYPDSKSDLFAVFIERNLSLAIKSGLISMITMQSWMFLSSYEELRSLVIEEGTILSMIHLGARAFDSIGGEVVSTTAFIIQNRHQNKYKGNYLRLIDGENEKSKTNLMKIAAKNSNCGWHFTSSAEDFKKIPGHPIAYWVSKSLLSAFEKSEILGDLVPVKKGLDTGKNDEYLRFWHEIDRSKFGVHCKNAIEFANINAKWAPHDKGGSFRRWFGNNEYVINWGNDGSELKSSSANLRSEKYYFNDAITWSSLSNGDISFRLSNQGAISNTAGSSLYPDKQNIWRYIALLNCKVIQLVLNIISPTINYSAGPISQISVINQFNNNIEELAKQNIDISRNDWNSFETSWEYMINCLVANKGNIIKKSFDLWRIFVKNQSNLLKINEEALNLEFIHTYGLEGEIEPGVLMNRISLTSNPYFRYDSAKSEAELEALQLADTMREFVSYAVGCMFGRYSIDKPGLILANQGETIADYLNQIPLPTFMPAEDNVIPILDGDWFADDITERFRAFLQTTFGMDHFQENLHFIEDAIGKDIRSFFLKDFYNDHIKRYKKRPIYWLFSSPKGTFNALIYMHRYCSDTVSIILNKYLREFKVKLSARIEYLNRVEVSTNASKAEKTSALKEREALKKNIDELDAWERDVIYPLALEQKEIDLDDGVKVNYPKFGAALKKISGLEAGED